LSSRDVVIHMAHTSRNSNKTPRRVNPASVVGLIGGLSVVFAGVLRVIYGGQDPTGFTLAVLAGFVMFGLFIGYWLLRFRNATVYFRDGRVGLTDAFGLRRDLPAADVGHIIRKVETPYKNRESVAVLLIVSKRGKRVLRFTRADRLEPGGVERLAAAIGVPVEGSW
jgi:hypothetical protein